MKTKIRRILGVLLAAMAVVLFTACDMRPLGYPKSDFLYSYLYSYKEELKLDDTIDYIDDKAVVKSMKKIEGIDVLIIGDLDGKGAFNGTKHPKSITISDGIKIIKDEAFANCQNLESVKIPNSVTSIGYNAFENCTKLKSIIIPDSVTFLGVAFDGCETEVTYKGKTYSPNNYFNLYHSINS